MADPTKPCPNCDTFVLEETRQCLRCGYRFDTHKVEPIERQSMDSEITSTTREVECHECGAPVREHLVRCWKCGTFMRPEIAERYREMLERQPTVEFQPLPDWDAANRRAKEAKEAENEGATYAMSSSGAGDDDGFEMDDDEAAFEDEDDFEMDAELEDDGGGETSAPPVRRGSTEAPPVRRDSGEAATTEGAEAAPNEGGESADAPQEAGVDALMDIAIQEEKELAVRRKREELKRRKRAAARKKARETGVRPRAKKKPAGPVAGKYTFWMNDVPLHAADPKKVKPRPGVLEKPTQTVDLGFSGEGLLVVSYVKEKKGSLFGKATKPEDARKAVQEHLRKDKSLEELPAERYWFVPVETASIPAYEQPNEYAHETIFGGVPVFGEGRIAVRLANGEEGEPKRFLVFTLSLFRRFAKYAGETFGPKGFGGDRGVPLKDETEKLVCNYTEQEMQALLRSAYYVADPEIALQVIGRRCQNCELVVSEDGRKKEKIGGKTGSGIAKAKCPKCGEKFGDVTLFERVARTPARTKASASA